VRLLPLLGLLLVLGKQRISEAAERPVWISREDMRGLWLALGALRSGAEEHQCEACSEDAYAAIEILNRIDTQAALPPPKEDA
jgi:hypothetical protein